MSNCLMCVCPHCSWVDYGLSPEEVEQKKDLEHPIYCDYCHTPMIMTDVLSKDYFNPKDEIWDGTRKHIFEYYVQNNPLYDPQAKEQMKIFIDNRTYGGGSFPSGSSMKCPVCGSTSFSKITVAHKVKKVAFLGVFGMGDNGKTWRCNKCGSKF